MSIKNLFKYYLECLQYESYHSIKLNNKEYKDALVHDITLTSKPISLINIEKRKPKEDECIYVGYPIVFTGKYYIPLALWEYEKNSNNIYPSDGIYFHQYLYEQLPKSNYYLLEKIKDHVEKNVKVIFNINEMFVNLTDELEALNGSINWNPIIFLSKKKIPVNYYIMTELEQLIKGKQNPNLTTESFFSEDHSPVTKKDHLYHIVPSNDPQNEAIIHQSGRIKVIQGPPGTGKTQTILNLIANQLINGKNILIASTNNPAVDNVLEKLDKEGILNIFPGVVRFGNKELVKKEAEALIEKTESIFKNNPENKDEFLKAQLKTLQVQSDSLLNRLNQLEKEISRNEMLKSREKSLSTLLKQIKRRIDVNNLTNLAEDFQKISSPEKFEIILSEYILEEPRVSNNFLEKLKISFLKWFYKSSFPNLKIKLNKIDKELSRKILSEIDVKDPRYSVAILHDIFRFLRLSSNYLDVKKQLETNEIAIIDYAQKMREVYNNKISVDREILSLSWQLKVTEIQKSDKLGNIVNLLHTLNQNQKVNNSDSDSFNDFIKLYPLTLTSNLSARRTIPDNFQYDLVIVDESSQCSIPSLITLLQSAKQICLIGDQKQLSHIAAIDSKDNVRLWEGSSNSFPISKYSYTDISAFDRALLSIYRNDKKQFLLSHHYRCAPKIINFSNREFYSGRLKIKTEEPKNGINSVQFFNVLGDFDNKVNRAECEKVKEIVDYLYEKGIKGIGVVTPFRNQKRILSQLLGTKARVGTIHTFQGGECEAIVFSAVIAPGASAHQIDFVQNNLRMINVAVTRAIQHLIVIGCEKTILSHNGYLKDLVQYIKRVNESVDIEQLPIKMIQIEDEFLKYRKKIMHDGEKRIFNLINGKLEDYPVTVYPKVPVKDTIFYDKETKGDGVYNYYLMAHFDFVIYQKDTLIPLFAVEYDGQYHRNNSQVKINDQKKDYLCSKAQFPIVRINSQDENIGWSEIDNLLITLER